MRETLKLPPPFFYLGIVFTPTICLILWPLQTVAFFALKMIELFTDDSQFQNWHSDSGS